MDEDFRAKSAREWRDERARKGGVEPPDWDDPPKAKMNGAHGPKAEGKPLSTSIIGKMAAQPLPERRFLDGHNFILMDAVHVLNGDGGAGKTDVMCQLAVACQSNMPFLGLPVRLGPVLIYSAEEPVEELRRRIHNICDDQGIDPATMNGLHVIDRSRQPAWLFVERDRKFATTPTWDELKATVAAIKPIVTMVDNRARIFAGNQNDTVMATSAVTELDSLGYENQTAVLLLSHPSLSGMASGRGDSGSVAWANAGRSRSFLAHPDWRDREPDAEDDGRRILTNMKANYGKPGKFVEFVWKNGYLNCTYEPPKADAGIGVLSKAQRVFLFLLRWHVERNKEVSPNPHSTGKYAPKVFAKHSQREGLSIVWFEKAMEALLNDNRIEIRTRGKSASPVQYLVVAAG